MNFFKKIAVLTIFSKSIIAFANVSVTAGDCSGVLFKMAGMSETQKALVLTDGHCVGFGGFQGQYPDDQELFINKSVEDTVVIHKDKEMGASVEYKTVLFATMTGVDLAILELEITYKQLAEEGYKIYVAASELPKPGMVLGFDSYNRDINSTCEVDKMVSKLKEGPWTWKNFARLKGDSQCQYVHGQSGTGGIEPKSGLIYALAQTMYEGGTACEFNNPCEIDPKTGAITTAEVHQGYAVPVAGLYSCYDESSGQFDFEAASCKLNFKKNSQ